MLGNQTGLRIEGKSNSRSQSRRSAGIVSAVLLVAILILALLGNSEIILVISLYICILLEGISLSVFIMYSRFEDEDPFPTDSHRSYDGGKGNDVVNSMNVYVKYASRGSDHSRREMTHVIKNVMEDSASKKYRDLSNDRLFQSDLERVVIPFTPDGNQTPGKQFGRAPKTRVSRQEREDLSNKFRAHCPETWRSVNSELNYHRDHFHGGPRTSAKLSAEDLGYGRDGHSRKKGSVEADPAFDFV